MANEKLKLAQTDIENLLANLRGEIGEVITGWLLMRHFVVGAHRLRTGDLQKDFADSNIRFASVMADKLSDELVGRLSELAEKKIGRLTFYFAARKINALTDEVSDFEKYIIKSKIRDKRNQDIAHKQFPGAKSPPIYLLIPYHTLLRAVAFSLRLMKRIDRRVLGPSAPFLWREARKRRYEFLSPPRVGYMLVPYFNLSPEDRNRIALLEEAEGKQI
jgi:predicted transcriptional regulator